MLSEPAPTVAPAPDQTPPGASGGEPVQQVNTVSFTFFFFK